MKPISKLPHVLITGAGIGGLALAQGLKRANISFTILERDDSYNFRPQGYRINISSEGGDYLKTLLRPELFDLFERTCAERKLGISMINPLDGTVLMSKEPPAPNSANPIKKNYCVDRTTLRRVLLIGLEDHVKYGKKFEKYVQNTQNRVTAHFTDRTTEEGSLLVGADGLGSRVRKQFLPNYKLYDVDGRCIYGKTPITKELKEKFLPAAIKWITFMQDKRHQNPLTLILEPVRFLKDVAKETEGRVSSVEDYIFWALFSRKAVIGLEDSEFLGLSKKGASDLTRRLTKEWSPSVRALFDLQDESQPATIRLVTHSPAIPAWTPCANVTLIGDAVHVMPPTGGVGAVTALRDAVALYKAIVEGGINTESIGKYEGEMREYSKTAIERSVTNDFFKMFQLRPLEECKLVEEY